MQHVEVVVGGQYGSEAKGHVTAQLVKIALKDATAAEVPDFTLWNVRVAGPNAGHTVYDHTGAKFAFRHLPVGAVISDDVMLYIAPGSEIDLEVLRQEIELAEDHGWNVRERLYISQQATVIGEEHKRTEAETELVERVGSTGKGIGAARADRIMRTAQTMGQRYASYGDEIPGGWWTWAEPEDIYADDSLVHDANQHVIIEGTQGYGLSLRASGHYPQVTSSDCRSIDFLAMAGIDPTRCNVVVTNWIVCRVFPIRVAGNSGPMEGETSWAELGLDEERTTVTQKVRRVGQWDQDLVRRAVQANGGHNANVVITMLDQAIPELKEFAERYTDGYDGDLNEEPVMEQVAAWIEEHAAPEHIGARVAGFTFSPTQMIFTEFARSGGEEPDFERLGVTQDQLREMVNSALAGAVGDALQTGTGTAVIDLDGKDAR